MNSAHKHWIYLYYCGDAPAFRMFVYAANDSLQNTQQNNDKLPWAAHSRCHTIVIRTLNGHHHSGYWQNPRQPMSSTRPNPPSDKQYLWCTHMNVLKMKKKKNTHIIEPAAWTDFYVFFLSLSNWNQLTKLILIYIDAIERM